MEGPGKGRTLSEPAPSDLGRRLAARLGQATFERIADLGLSNAEANRRFIARSVLELTGAALGTGDSAIVIGAGPSLHRRHQMSAGLACSRALVTTRSSSGPSIASPSGAPGSSTSR